MTIGIAFLELRVAAGLTQRAAGELLGCTHVHLCNIEKGQTGVSLELIAKAHLVYTLFIGRR